MPETNTEQPKFRPAISAEELALLNTVPILGSAPEVAGPVEQAVKPNPGMQDDIARALVMGETGNFGKDSEPPPHGVREAAMNWLGDGRVGEEEIRKIVLEGRTPWQAPEGAAAPYDAGKLIETSKKLEGNPKHHELLGLVTDGVGAEQDQTDAQRLLALVDGLPDPVGFEKAAMNTLKVAAIPEASRAALAADIAPFMKVTYGEQAEILEQINLMKAEAKALAIAESEPEPYGLLPPEISRAIMGRVEIHGSPYYDRDSKTTTRLTPDMLDRAGLDPKYSLQVGDISMFFSEPYINADDRMSVITYMAGVDGRVVARNLYKSNSGDLRRLHQRHWPNGHYDKGPGESSLPAPFEVQAALAKICQHEPRRVQRPDVIFHGTASDIQVEQNTFGAEIEPYGEKLKGNFYADQGEGHWLVPPEQADFTDPNEAPDYSGEPLLSWDDASEQRGKFKVQVYPSKDGKRRFAVATDEQGRTNFLGVENVGGKLAKTGQKRQWVEAGALTTPMYEYGSQADGYGNLNDRKGQYLSMWDNYHSKLPEVRRYQAAMAAKAARRG